MVGRTGENFGVEKRWKKKKKKIGQGGWDFRPSRKRPQRVHPQLVHWWVLIHSSPTMQEFAKKRSCKEEVLVQ